MILACIGGGGGPERAAAVLRGGDHSTGPSRTRTARLLALLAGAMVGLAMASGLIGVLQQTLTARVGQSIMYDLRNELYRHLQRMSLRFYTSTRSGEIVSRINNDVNAVQGVATGTLVTIASNVATLAATSIALFSTELAAGAAGRGGRAGVLPALADRRAASGGGCRCRRRRARRALLAFLNERLHVGGSLLTNIFGQREADAREFAERQRAGARPERQADGGRAVAVHDPERLQRRRAGADLLVRRPARSSATR